MLVRRERPGDEAAVHAVVAAAFARPDVPVTAEEALLRELRLDRGWIDALSLVALDSAGDDVIGHVVCTRGFVDDHPALGLGPIAVQPDVQRTGIGSALMHAVLGAAEALDEGLVALLGEPAFYARFGFRSADEFGIAAPSPEWGAYFQVRLIGSGPPPRGLFRYAEPFQRL
jgi:putative acetyltransferase